MFRRLIVSLALAGAMAGTTVPAHATHDWNGYHWARTANPFTISLVDSVTDSWNTYLTSVSADWTASSVLDSVVAAGDDSTRTRKKCPTVIGKMRVCNASYGFNGWLGISEIWISGSHIVRARARVNDSYFSRASYNNPYARRHVLCQEVGHAFGLGHQYAVSCMNDDAGISDPAYVSPNAHDFEELESIYGHLDSSTSVSSPSGGGQPQVHQDGELTRVRWVFRAR